MNEAAGRLTKAPENFLDAAGVRQVFCEARRGRRDFIRSAFAAAGATAAAPIALAAGNPVPPAGGDANILELPEHSKGLGQSGGHRRLRQAVDATSATCSAAKARA